MAKDNDKKTLTIDDIREVLIPAMEEVFTTKSDLEAFEQRAMDVFASKQDLQSFVTKGEFTGFKNMSLSNQDRMLKNLDVLMTEKVMRDHQKKKERKLWAIMIDAMKRHKILSSEQLEDIDELEVF